MYFFLTILFSAALFSSCSGKNDGKKAEETPSHNYPAPPAPSTPSVNTSTVTSTLSNTSTSVSTTTELPQALFEFRQDVLVSIIDSGVDDTHSLLSAQMWKNSGETENNFKDDEGNGYIDDIFGWSFIDNNNRTFDRTTLQTLPNDVHRFYQILAKISKSQTLTSEEYEWYSARYTDNTFLAQAEKFSTLSHGSHVAGIVLKDNPRTRVMAQKILSTDVAMGNSLRLSNFALGTSELNAASFFIRSFLPGIVGGNSAFHDIFRYAQRNNVKVANCSFSTTLAGIKEGIENYYSLNSGMGGAFVDYTVTEVFERARQSLQSEVAQAQDILFVMAAGNDAVNNDNNPRLPANIKLVNTITVAATNGRSKLAEFSDYGWQMVEVAAPGVSIESAVGNNQVIPMSGTSMAAPYVSNAAAQVRSINPKLSAAETRKIILETVDVKAFLQNKVSTSGIVNPLRAKVAAELAFKMSLPAAIAQAKEVVKDLD